MHTARPTERVFIYPGWDDPRWLQLAFLFSYDLYALASPGFSRTVAQFAAAVASCVFVDLGLLLFYRRLFLAPVSGLITGFATLLLCDAPSVWPYLAVGALSILSKHVIRVDGRHVFNPLNFGLVTAVLFLSEEVTIVPGRWGGSLDIMLVVVCLGAAVAHRASRLDLAGAYVLTFLVGALARQWVTGMRLASVLAPMTGAAFYLFTFNMITDPMTTPETRKGRWVFGVSLGMLDAVLRFLQIQNAPFYSLFILSGFLPFFRRAFIPAVGERIWRPRRAHLSWTPR